MPRRRKRARVRVHETRHGRELIVDETFASYYRPGQVATGSVWDAIAAPLLALPPARRRRVLVLGLGARSVARIVRALAPQAEITGVELDAEVIAAAREAFDLDAMGIEVVCDDALAFLERPRGPRYDAIFEDVFLGRGDDVRKPAWLPHPGHALAARRLARGGVFVSNTLDEYPQVAHALGELFQHRVAIEVEDYDNRIVAASNAALSGRSLRAALAATPELAESLEILSFRTLPQVSSSRN